MGVEETQEEVQEPAEEKEKPQKPKKKQKEKEAEKKSVEIEAEEPKKEIKKEVEAKKQMEEQKEEQKENSKPTNKSSEKKEKWSALNGEAEGQLAIDVYQTEEELVIRSAIAGVKPENLDISIEGDMVSIKGTREKPVEEEGNYFYQECFWGPFSRRIIMPMEADAGRAEATMKEGVLTVRMPKIQREKKKKIIVKERASEN